MGARSSRAADAGAAAAGAEAADPAPADEPGESAPLLPRKEDAEERVQEDVEESSYSATMFLTLRDLQKIHGGSKYNSIRMVRVLFAHLVLWVLIAIQVFLLIQVKTMVCSPAVKDIREMYDSYQRTMYGGHVKESGWGFVLGVGGPKGPYFQEQNFSKLDKDFKHTLCQFPFSQREFLGVLLLIWTLTCIGELKTSAHHLNWLAAIPDIPLHEAIVRDEEDGTGAVVMGLPLYMKALLSVMVIPRILITCILCWLGCRWLASTTDFGNVLANSVALEFIVALNGLLYDKLMSDRNKRELQGLKMDFRHEGTLEPSAIGFLATFGWGIFAAVWVYVYIFHLQMVIPGYQWDVKGPCSAWAGDRFDFWRM